MSNANETQVGGMHYKKQRIQHWDVALANEMPYMDAQILKYVMRWRDKNGVEDLEKAAHYLQKLIEWEKGERPVIDLTNKRISMADQIDSEDEEALKDWVKSRAADNGINVNVKWENTIKSAEEFEARVEKWAAELKGLGVDIRPRNLNGTAETRGDRLQPYADKAQHDSQPVPGNLCPGDRYTIGDDPTVYRVPTDMYDQRGTAEEEEVARMHRERVTGKHPSLGAGYGNPLQGTSLEAGDAKRDGYIGYVYEGGTPVWDAYRCNQCHKHFSIPPSANPVTYHAHYGPSVFDHYDIGPGVASADADYSGKTYMGKDASLLPPLKEPKDIVEKYQKENAARIAAEDTSIAQGVAQRQEMYKKLAQEMEEIGVQAFRTQPPTVELAHGPDRGYIAQGADVDSRGEPLHGVSKDAPYDSGNVLLHGVDPNNPPMPYKDGPGERDGTLGGVNG